MLPLANRRVLIAEDESLIALQLEQLLADLGCDVVGPATRVSEVLEIVETQKLAGALLDVNLRGETVLSALPRLSERNVPFIITSGYDAISLFPTEFQSVPRVGKPFDEDALRALCVSMFACP